MAAHAHVQDPDAPEVYVQYEDIDQQQESYVVGMWAFLVTEVMFFGAMFIIYAIYRWNFQADWYLAHKDLSILWGGVNTTVLLASSFLIALAVHFAQIKKKSAQLWCLGGTLLCAFLFLVVKIVFEWIPKFAKGYWPGPEFVSHYQGQADPEHARLFYSLYFSMTGLHGLHVLIGILIIGALMWLIHKNSRLITDHIPTEMVGLYWHFVDLVWIFLYPLFYLIPK